MTEEQQIQVQTPTPEIKKEDKGFWSKLFKKKGKEKVEEIPIVFLEESGKATLRYDPIKDGMIHINEKTYHNKPGSDWDLIIGKEKRKIKIIPSWGMYPLMVQDQKEELGYAPATVQNDIIKSISNAETVRQAEALENKTSSGFNPKTVVIIVIAAIVIGYFIMKGG